MYRFVTTKSQRQLHWERLGTMSTGYDQNMDIITEITKFLQRKCTTEAFSGLKD